MFKFRFLLAAAALFIAAGTAAAAQTKPATTAVTDVKGFDRGTGSVTAAARTRGVNRAAFTSGTSVETARRLVCHFSRPPSKSAARSPCRR